MQDSLSLFSLLVRVQNEKASAGRCSEPAKQLRSTFSLHLFFGERPLLKPQGFFSPENDSLVAVSMNQLPFCLSGRWATLGLADLCCFLPCLVDPAGRFSIFILFFSPQSKLSFGRDRTSFSSPSFGSPPRRRKDKGKKESDVEVRIFHCFSPPHSFVREVQFGQTVVPDFSP